MSVSQLLRSMDSHELSEWMEFWAMEAKDRKRAEKQADAD